MSDYQEISDYQNKHQKIRKQLIGFATLLLIIAIVAPRIITDKSDKQTAVDPAVHTIDLTKGSENNRHEVANILDNGDVVNVPRLPDGTTDFNTETESVAKIAPKTKPVSVPVSTGEQDKREKSVKPASETASKTKSTRAEVSATAQLKSEEKKYTIQLVALKNKQKIDELTALLLLHNYNVQVIPKNPEPNQVIKLQLGPYAKKEQAEQVIIDLKKITKLKGNILNN